MLSVLLPCAAMLPLVLHELAWQDSLTLEQVAEIWHNEACYLCGPPSTMRDEAAVSIARHPSPTSL